MRMKSKTYRVLSLYGAPGAAAFVVMVFVLGLIGCGGDARPIPPPSTELVEGETTAVSVFYPDGKVLIEERHVVAADRDLVKTALDRLFEAEPQEFEVAVVLPSASIRAVKVDGKTGVCTVDFSKEILDFPDESEKARIVAFAAIIETLKQFPEITAVTFLVEGKASGAIDGKQINAFWGNVTLPEDPIPITRETPPTAETT